MKGGSTEPPNRGLLPPLVAGEVASMKGGSTEPPNRPHHDSEDHNYDSFNEGGLY